MYLYMFVCLEGSWRDELVSSCVFSVEHLLVRFMLDIKHIEEEFYFIVTRYGFSLI